GHLTRFPAPRVRAVPAGRRLVGPKGRRPRSRAGDRPSRGRAARGPDGGPQPGRGTGIDLYPHPAGGDGSRRAMGGRAPRVRPRGAKEGAATPAVALSALAQASGRARAVAAGCGTPLAKPTGPDRLLRTLADALSLKTGEGAPRGAPSPPVLASGTGN